MRQLSISIQSQMRGNCHTRLVGGDVADLKLGRDAEKRPGGLRPSLNDWLAISREEAYAGEPWNSSKRIPDEEVEAPLRPSLRVCLAWPQSGRGVTI